MPSIGTGPRLEQRKVVRQAPIIGSARVPVSLVTALDVSRQTLIDPLRCRCAAPAHHGLKLAFDNPQTLRGDLSIGTARMLTQKALIELGCSVVLTGGVVGLRALQQGRLLFIIVAAAGLGADTEHKCD